MFDDVTSGSQLLGKRPPLGLIFRNFRLRMRTPKGIPSGDVWWRHFRWKGRILRNLRESHSGSRSLRSLPIAHAHTQWNPFGVTWPLVTGSHGTCTTTLIVVQNVPVAHAHTTTSGHGRFRTGPLPVRAASGQGLFRSRDLRCTCARNHFR